MNFSRYSRLSYLSVCSSSIGRVCVNSESELIRNCDNGFGVCAFGCSPVYYTPETDIAVDVYECLCVCLSVLCSDNSIPETRDLWPQLYIIWLNFSTKSLLRSLFIASTSIRIARGLVRILPMQIGFG